MKNTSFFLIIFLLLYNFQVKAETTIGYVDMQLVMNKSEPGIFIKKKIDNLNIKSEKNFSARAEILKKQEEDLIKKKNLIEKEVFEKEYIKLKSEVDDYNKKKNISVKNIRNKMIELNSKFLKEIEPILIDYSESKKISFLLQKKNIILGSKEFDITNDIILIVNKKINKNNFK